MLAAAALLVVSYFAAVVNPEKAWFMEVFGVLFIPIVALNVVFLIFAFLYRSKSAWIPFLALVPSIILFGKYYQFKSGGVEREDPCLKVMTYNVGSFVHVQGDTLTREECMDSIARYVLESGADIVCLQEANYNGQNVSEELSEYFPGYENCYFMNLNEGTGNNGNVILSKYPILGKDHFDFEDSANLAIYSDIQVGSKVIRIYNCHFESYSISISGLAKALGKNDTLAMHQTENKVRNAIARRPSQVDMVVSDMENSSVESIVTGDFNDTPMSYTYHSLMKGRKDSFVEAGKGFGTTYSLLWPLIRIDYILYPDHLQAVSNTIPHLRYSDHYPVVAEINL